MGNESYKPLNAREAGVVLLFGSFVVGAAGAISSQDCKGFDVVKTAGKTGRYTLALDSAYPKFLSASVTLQGPADAAFGTGATAGYVRNVDVKHKTLDLQFSVVATTNVDGDLPANTVVFVALTLKNSTAW